MKTLWKFICGNSIAVGFLGGMAAGLIPAAGLFNDAAKLKHATCGELANQRVEAAMKDHCCKCTMTELNYCGPGRIR